MKLRPLMFATAMILFAALATSVQLAAQEQNQHPSLYTVTDLGTLGGTFGTANAVNNRGSVVGFATLPGDTEGHAFLWSKGIKSNLGTLGGPNSSATFVNERALVTFWILSKSVRTTSNFLWKLSSSSGSETWMCWRRVSLRFAKRLAFFFAAASS
jgi:probable HAF family extracellular repeat protein